MYIPGGYGQFNIKFTGLNAPNGAEVTCGFQNVASLNAHDCVLQVHNSIVTDAGILGVLSEDITLSAILVKLGPNATGPSDEVSYNNAGTNTSADPPQTAILVRKVTATGGRFGRGRMYWPGVPGNGVVSTGQLESVFLSLWQDAMDAFLESMDTANLPLVLLHAEVSGGGPHVVTGLNVQPLAATQRRRLRG